MSQPDTMRVPSKWWYVGHIFFWIVTGLICYILWKDENPKAAKKHLTRSIWLGLVLYIPWIILYVTLIAFLPIE